MHGLAVLQCHHAQVLSQFGNENPMADALVRLNLAVYCFAQRSLALFTLDVWTFPQDCSSKQQVVFTAVPCSIASSLFPFRFRQIGEEAQLVNYRSLAASSSSTSASSSSRLLT